MHRNPSVTSAFKTYYDNVLSTQHNNAALIGRWGADPSRFETQIMCHKHGTPIPDSQKFEADGEVFGPMRWPYNSDTEPNYSDPPIQFNIATRLKAIGTSWWDWKNKRSIGIGFDFDSLIDHTAANVGIDQSEIERLDKLDIPWIEIIRSTRGNGRHIYIWFDPENAPITQNHNEHSAIARSFLPLLSEHTGLDIDMNVDCKGLIMWIYHVNATRENRGYECIKPATQILTADHVPPNWRDNLEVVSGSRNRVRVQGWTADGTQTKGDELDDMTQAYSRVELDETHLKILEALEGTGHTCLWVHDHHLWQGHTGGLKQVYEDFAERGTPLRGLFDTNSGETDPGKPNCFMRPKPNGAWDVYRFGEGTGECSLWDTQGKWTHIMFNYPATLRQICVACGGYEAPKAEKGFLFDDLEGFKKAVEMLGGRFSIPAKADKREVALRMQGEKVVATVEKKNSDEKSDFKGWSKGTGVWERVLADVDMSAEAQVEEEKLWADLDNKVRALKVVERGGEFDSWAMFDESQNWTTQPRENIKSYLTSLGYGKPDAVIGGAVFKSWTLTNEPFGPEYPGGRKWNRNAVQFVYQPVTLEEGQEPTHPTWNRLLEHCGVELNEYIPDLPWCRDWGITTGGQYLLAWVACMVQKPYCKLPYLFMYGPQNSGKSSFHESLALLFTTGVEKADRALTSSQGYNGELRGVILAVIDEVNVNKTGPEVYNKLKEWVTGETFAVHAKYKQVATIKSTLHFVQVANERSALPVFPGDTRITAMNVPPLEEEIPRDLFREKLRAEAPHFMRTLLDFEVQPPTGRLALPIIITQGKLDAENVNTDELNQFIEERCFKIPGSAVKFADFYDRFIETVEDHLKSNYSKRLVKQRVSEMFPIGEQGAGAIKQAVVGNLTLNGDTAPSEEWVKMGPRLVKRKEENE